jgi:L,D-transpeptidase ErfK/SrfK
MFRLVVAAAAGSIALLSTATGIQLSRDIAGGVIEYTVAAADTLPAIGSRMGIDVATIAAANGLSRARKLSAGQVLHIDNRHIVPAVRDVSVVVNIPQRMLFLFDEGAFVQAFPVALGRPTWPTPAGRFSILTKELDPIWDVPVSIQREMEREGKPRVLKVPPGPDNPLGDRWFGLSLGGVGIHGTNSPGTIYHHQTHGCIRLHPDDVRTMFDRVPVGATGEIVYEPVLFALVDGRVHLESHPDIYRRFSKPLERLRASADRFHLTDAIDWELASAVIRGNAGIARDITAAVRCSGLDSR